jgi:hypothetical protein
MARRYAISLKKLCEAASPSAKDGLLLPLVQNAGLIPVK